MATENKVNIQAFWHMGLAKDADETAERYWKQLGIGPWGKFTFSEANCKMALRGEPISLAVKAGMTQVGPLVVSIDQGLSRPHPYEDLVDRRGGGAHHLAFLVEQWERAAEQMRQAGYGYDFSIMEVGGFRDAGGAYFNTIDDFGTVIELSSPPAEMPAPDAVYPSPDEMLTGGKLDIKGVAHVAIAVRDAEKVAQRYWETFGIGPWAIYSAFGADMRAMTYRGKPGTGMLKVAIAQVGPLQIALEQPLTSPAPLQDFLDRYGQGIHHICLVVDRVDAAIEEMRRAGYQVMATFHGFGSKYDGEAAYLETEKDLGLVIEVAKPPSEMPAPDRIYPAP